MGFVRLVLPLLLLAACSATASSTQTPEVPGSLRAFDDEMRGWVERFKVSQASLAVMREDRLVLARGYGSRRAAERVDVWSLSKAITATCIATLVRERKIALDDPIGPQLSRLYERHGKPVDDRFGRVTVAELLTHRGGWSRRVGGNGFPGLIPLLRERATRTVTAEMLMPEILRSRLSRDPGRQYEYSNVGYLLLGQTIEARTGEPYAEACRQRVLAKAGIRNAALDPVWGGILQSAGGWSLNGPEYLAFLRVLRPRDQDLLSPELRAWLTDGRGKWIDEAAGLAYTLGVLVNLPAKTLLHSGSWTWRQPNAAEGPIAFKQGTSAVLTADGTAWFASFDTVNSDQDPEATRVLDAALWSARRATTAWPDVDLFERFGVGPVVIRE